MAEQTTATLRRSAPAGPLGVILRVTNRPARPRAFRLVQGSCVCGAAPDADIVIADETVSRRHLELTLVPEGVRVRDLSSHNGTWYVGQRIQDGVLGAGSAIRLGLAELRIEPDRRELEHAASPELDGYGAIVGTSPPIRRLYAVLERIESSLANVLIEGESGTGKELIARAIHEHSAVASGPFVAVNCGALERPLVRSELFGHKRGAFTGALENREGAFEAASGGTLFLDEIAELPTEVQPVFLRALELGIVTRLGENVDRPVNARIIAATNRSLEAEMRAGRFREDLYFRLMVVPVAVPPLRERPDDISVLAAHFAQSFGLEGLTEDLLRELRARTWPGNVRELKNAIQTYSVLGTLPSRATAREAELDDWLHRMVDLDVPYAVQKDALLKHFLRVYLEALLARTGGNKSLAARVSGLERSYLNKVANQLRCGTAEEPEPGTDEST
ncbi:MAG TPA: sigma 54-interacting transcriptional regulator [Polyangiaceae bacterium]